MRPTLLVLRQYSESQHSKVLYNCMLWIPYPQYCCWTQSLLSATRLSWNSCHCCFFSRAKSKVRKESCVGMLQIAFISWGPPLPHLSRDGNPPGEGHPLTTCLAAKYIPLARKNKEPLEASGVPFIVNYLEVILLTVELTWKSTCSFSWLMSRCSSMSGPTSLQESVFTESQR